MGCARHSLACPSTRARGVPKRWLVAWSTAWAHGRGVEGWRGGGGQSKRRGLHHHESLRKVDSEHDALAS